MSGFSRRCEVERKHVKAEPVDSQSSLTALQARNKMPLEAHGHRSKREADQGAVGERKRVKLEVIADSVKLEEPALVKLEQAVVKLEQIVKSELDDEHVVRTFW